MDGRPDKTGTSPLEKQWRTASEPRELLRTLIGGVLSQRFECRRTGAEQEFISLDFRDWVVVAAVTDDDELVLIRQFRHGTRKVHWEIPGGLIESSDSDPLEAAVRELLEETGFQGENPRLLARIHPNPAIQSNVCHVVLIEHARRVAEPAMDELECIEHHIVPFPELLHLLRHGEFDHGVAQAAILHLLIHRGVFS